MRILLVEDDDGVAGAVANALGAHGHTTERVIRGTDALTRLRDAELMLLDLKLPDRKDCLFGLEVLRELRQRSAMPVIVLTATGDERTVVRALHLGANDYVVKPVRLKELLARIERLPKLLPERAPSVVRVRDVVIDLVARRVAVGDREVELTTKQFDILAVLARNHGMAVSRQRLLDEVWGNASVAVSRSLDVHLTKLREKLNRPGLIVTIRGFGYQLAD